jgi:cell division protein FtsZ
MAKLKKKKAESKAKKMKKITLRRAQGKKSVKRRRVLAKKPKIKTLRLRSGRAKQIKKIVAKKSKVKKIRRKITKKRKIIVKKQLARKKKIIIKKKPIIKRKKVVSKKKIVVKKEAQKPKAVKKQIQKAENTEFPADTLFKARIKVIGIGGGGGSIVSEIGRSLEKATFVIADTDIRALKKKSGIKYFWFGEELTHGLGTGVNVDLAKRAAESAKEKISSVFQDQDIIIFIASLGGGLGSGATQVFAQAAKEFGGITLGIFTLPFKFEGKNKHKIAQNALKLLKQSLNVSLIIPNEKIFKIIDANTPIIEAFSTVNKSLIGSLESLIDLIYSPGIINIDFADLRTILKGVGNSAFLNTAEESGKNRAEKVCEKILINPLLQNNNFIAEKILFNIAGSENLSMFEVEKISRHIANLNPKAKIIFGISKSSKLKNKIKTTILMTGGGVKTEVRIKKAEPVEEPIKKEEKKKIKPPRAKKHPPKKPGQKPIEEKEQKPVSFIPVFEVPVPQVPVLEQKRINVIEPVLDSTKNLPAGRHGTIRRSGLEIKKAEEREEKKRIAQEKEWEIPTFLRRVKFNK